MYKIKILITLIGFFYAAQTGLCQESNSRDSLKNSFFNAEVLTLKQQYYDTYLARFPQNKANKKDPTYDDFRQVLALNYLLQKDSVKFNSYTDLINNKVQLAEQLNNVASHWLEEKSMVDAAEKLSSLTMRLNAQFLKDPERYKPADYSTKDWNLYLLEQKYLYLDIYASILHKQGQSQKALSMIEPV